ncbi:hypothetical protein, partial [Streptomyces sp. NPDC006333]|uniref:hypothetical protein n=1 Tax=Streptomyces sp. NPDC006333 TaxID=3156753 RepID=UPI0033B3E16F
MSNANRPTRRYGPGISSLRRRAPSRRACGQRPRRASGTATGPAGEVSGYGLFWGLFIGQLMVLV